MTVAGRNVNLMLIVGMCLIHIVTRGSTDVFWVSLDKAAVVVSIPLIVAVVACAIGSMFVDHAKGTER